VQDLLTTKPRQRFSLFNRPMSSRVDNVELTNMESADPFFENIVARQSKEPVSFNDNAVSSDRSSDLSKSSNELPHPNKSFAYVSAGPWLRLPPCTRLTR
jgi:hypothetical protein